MTTLQLHTAVRRFKCKRETFLGAGPASWKYLLAVSYCHYYYVVECPACHAGLYLRTGLKKKKVDLKGHREDTAMVNLCPFLALH